MFAMLYTVSMTYCSSVVKEELLLRENLRWSRIDLIAEKISSLEKIIFKKTDNTKPLSPVEFCC